MKFGTVSAGIAALAATTAASEYPEYDMLQFENLGYDGYYYAVSKIEALSDGSCECAKDIDNPVLFDGPISPLNEELTVQFRGPMNLLQFGYYVSNSYESGQTTGSWERLAYYDAVEGTADNVTFLANYGTDNECLGSASDYVSADGLSKADEATILDNTTIPSAREFTIASGIKCNGTSDCGAYRTDGAAYHGFYGVNKMFLFEFMAPTDDSESGETNKTDGYDMPAIWLLNAQITRTSQYPINPNCSSWNSGSGEFDIFEVMNYTERNMFYSTIHTFQGISDLSDGLVNPGYLERTPGAIMRGGVVFGEDKTATVFLSNSTTLNSTIENSDLNSWLTSLESDMEKDTLESITISPPSSTSVSSVSSSTKTKKNDAAAGVLSNPMLNAAAYAGLGLLCL